LRALFALTPARQSSKAMMSLRPSN
jgi:hypothetical protein